MVWRLMPSASARWVFVAPSSTASTTKKSFGHLVSKVSGLYQDVIMVKVDVRFDVVFKFQIEPLADEFKRFIFVRYIIEQ